MGRSPEDADIKIKILNWLFHGEVGAGSKTMAGAVIGEITNEDFASINCPFDKSDFGRCVKFLDAVPEARLHLDKVAALGKVWKRLIDNWDELEAFYKKNERYSVFTARLSKIIYNKT